MLETAIACLALNVYHEARGEPVEGQYAVALVTINRARKNPQNVCREVYRHKQFSWTLTPGLKVTDWKAYKRSVAVAKRAWALKDFTAGADHFHTTDVSPPWASNLEYAGQWGNHYFYRSHKVATQ